MKNPTRKIRIALTVTLGSALCMVLTSCAAFRNGAPPTALESKFFNVTTNQVPVIAYVTNTVPVIAYHTNTIPVVQTIGVNQFLTNYQTVTVPQTNFQQVTALVTNMLPSYTWTPNSNTNTIEGAVSAIPVYGTLASTLIAALAAGWGWVRSSKNGAAAATLAQSIETMRQVVKALPNGAALDNEITGWLQQHQTDTNTVKTVVSLLATEVSNPDAQIAAQQILATINALYQTPAPPSATTATAKV